MGNNVRELSSVPAAIEAGEWQFLALTRNATTMQLRFFVDGQRLGDAIDFANLPDGGDSSFFYVGADQSFPTTDNLDGRIDEVRVEPVHRSEAWMAAQYESMSDTLIIYGPLQGP